MGADTVFSPERSFRHAMGHLNHVLDLQVGSPRERPGHHPFPPCKLGCGANERFPRADEPYLPPHGPSKGATYLFGIFQSFQLAAFQALHMVTQIGHRTTSGPGYSTSAGPHSEYQPFQQ